MRYIIALITLLGMSDLWATSAPPAPAKKKSEPSTNAMLKPKELWEVSKKGPIGKAEFKRYFIHQIATLEKEDPNLNKIPAHNSKGELRVMTYNVHGFMPPTKEFKEWPCINDFTAIFDVIKAIDPDIMVLQEFNESFKFGKYTVYQWFEHIGYKYHTLAQAPKNKPYGVAILSKIPFKGKPYLHTFNNKIEGQRDIRSFGKVEIDLAKYGHRNLVIYGTHLDVGDPKTSAERRVAEIEELKKAASKYDKGKNVIIAADFNESHNGNALKLLESEQNGGCFQDCFAAAGLHGPHFTHWSGRILDYIYLKTCYRSKGKLRSDWDLPITGCYLYYSAASDHMPVILDIKYA